MCNPGRFSMVNHHPVRLPRAEQNIIAQRFQQPQKAGCCACQRCTNTLLEAAVEGQYERTQPQASATTCPACMMPQATLWPARLPSKRALVLLDSCKNAWPAAGTGPVAEVRMCPCSSSSRPGCQEIRNGVVRNRIIHTPRPLPTLQKTTRRPTQKVGSDCYNVL
ncbi:hypothetical protein LY76DRAFT_113815 [Colletotrichum caudatum]|nr:hypothetical protein LY76DRAFT_113815 [Colletotrichum caudatum]